MRWNPFRSRATPDGGPEAGPGKPPTDKLTMAIRQRRMFTAQQRVDQLPGFTKLERRWCEPPTADRLDARLADDGAGVTTEQWPEEALIDALRAAAPLTAQGTGFALLPHEPEARWVEAQLADLLTATAAGLDHLPAGIVVFDDQRSLKIGAPTEGEGARRREVALQGEWPLPAR